MLYNYETKGKEHPRRVEALGLALTNHLLRVDVYCTVRILGLVLGGYSQQGQRAMPLQQVRRPAVLLRGLVQRMVENDRHLLAGCHDNELISSTKG